DLEPTPAGDGSWVAFLPGLDATTMGWHEQAFYLWPPKGKVFDPNVNAGPTIWLDGRIVGGWAQRRSGDIALKVIDDVGREATNKIQERADDLRSWLGDLRFVPRF